MNINFYDHSFLDISFIYVLNLIFFSLKRNTRLTHQFSFFVEHAYDKLYKKILRSLLFLCFYLSSTF